MRRIVIIVGSIAVLIGLVVLLALPLGNHGKATVPGLVPETTVDTARPVLRLALSPNGGPTVTTTRGELLQFVDLNRAECALVNSDLFAECIAISPDGSVLAVGGAGGPAASRAVVKVWDLKTHAIRGSFDLGRGTVYAVVFDPAGCYVYAGNHIGNGAVDRLDLSAGTVTRVFGPKSVTKVPTDWDHGIYSLAIVPGGEELVIGMRMGVLVWDLKTSTEKRSIIDPKRGSSCLAVSPDKKQLASAGSGMTVSDFGSGKIIHERRLDNRGGSVCGLAFSPDGKFLVDGVSLGRKSPGYIVVWRTNDYSTESVFPCHTSAFRTMAFMPGTHKIVTGAEDGTVCVWDLDKLRWAESPKRAVTEEKSGSTQGGESGKGHKSN